MQFELYLDTLVFGAPIDANAARLAATERLLDAAATGRFRPVISGLVLEEVGKAPLTVRTRLEDAIRTIVPLVLQIGVDDLSSPSAAPVARTVRRV